MRRATILGVTGSIGQSTLDVLRWAGGREAVEMVAVTGHSNIDGIAAAAQEFGAQLAVTADPARYADLRAALSGTGIEAAAGPQAVEDAAALPTDWCMGAIVGAAGLAPTLAAARQGATVALANKECLVAAGDLFLAECAAHGARLLPVDSEHNAVFQVIEDKPEAIERVILTASGGPFRDWDRERMASVTAKEAAAHPNWDMGLKISIDSASMFNKALEMIEAKHLFGLAPEQVEVIVHPQSIIHSMVGYVDGSVLAQLGAPDMRHAIGYAWSWPERGALPVERLDFARLARLDFRAPDEDRFPALRLAREAMEAGGLAGAALNGAKEAALEAFIAGRIGFLQMAEVVEEALAALAPHGPALTLEAVAAADAAARRAASARVEALAA
ncbi:1-deoxy-D-xylulose-5-phosphate reductoisomerase [Rhodovulum sp. DZ06]|uniref:1-deoxy-D-xylulose-5-phosphate reductoisomerase n=1 Tax=Rhodovulum sp. DZ06 TaxID=3425126 RepID=UPI003D33171F